MPKAVTCDDFLAAMADANDFPLEDLAMWYGQPGTPQLTISTSYSPSDRTFAIKCTQKTSGQPVLIPIAVGLLGPDGKDMFLKLQVPPWHPCGILMVSTFSGNLPNYVSFSLPPSPLTARFVHAFHRSSLLSSLNSEHTSIHIVSQHALVLPCPPATAERKAAV